MEPNWITAIVSAIGLLLVTCGFLWGMYTWIKQSHRNRVNLHIQSLCDLYYETDLLTLLKCHGIDPEEFKSAEIEEDEFCYLLINFTISRMYQHGRWTLQVGPFRKDSYRYNLCKSEKTRKAFKFLKQILGNVEITRRIEATFKQIDEKRGRCLKTSKQEAQEDNF
jgi:hypothetical protein